MTTVRRVEVAIGGRVRFRSGAGGVNESTLRRWLTEDEAFQVDYAAARHSAFEAGMSRVQALTGKAIETLDELLGDKDGATTTLS